MDHFREVKNNLTWHSEGKFEVVVINGIITKLNFCEPGKGPDDLGKSLTSTNFKFLQSIYSCLSDLFTFIDEENKRLGYSYSREAKLPHYQGEETMDNTFPILPEIKLRPLINYDHQPELLQPSNEDNDLIRDIG